MTPDAEYDTRRIDGLLQSYGQLERTDAVLVERVDKHDQKFVEMWAGLEKVGEKCEEHVARVEQKIDAMSPKFGPAQRAIIIASVIAANGAVIAAMIGMLTPGS